MSFSQFLFGTLLVSSLIMLVLLVAPRPVDDVQIRSVPLVTAVLGVLLLGLGFLTGLTVAA